MKQFSDADSKRSARRDLAKEDLKRRGESRQDVHREAEAHAVTRHQELLTVSLGQLGEKTVGLHVLIGGVESRGAVVHSHAQILSQSLGAAPRFGAKLNPLNGNKHLLVAG